jgi:arylsulfatase A-like enzyme
MKLAAVVAGCFTITAAIEGGGVPIQPSKAEIWTFDRLENVGGHKTTVLGEPKIIESPVGKAVEFDGMDDALFVDNHPLAGAETFTFEAIFRPDGGQREQRWFHLSEQDPATGADTDNRMLFEIRVVEDKWFLDSYNQSGAASKALMNKTALHPLGEWYHVASVYDGKEFSNYVNGVKEGSAELQLAPHGPGHASIGVRINKVFYFKGAVHLARFTRKALAPSEFLKVQPRPPNIVLVYADDLGYADIGPFSAGSSRPRPQTPNLDRIAAEGVRLTSFYTAQAVCSASRAALLTGSYSNRVGTQGALNHTAKQGINASEMTIAEVLKQKGYATAIFGKWHLGHHKPFLPIHHGFDEYLGLPYSNDMWPRHPQRGSFFPELPLIEGDEVARLNPDQSQLTTWYTQRAVKFIENHRDQPFFLYVPHSMPHVPLFVSDKFKGKTGGGMYGDVIAEIDWSVGQILDALRRNALDDTTLVVFTSDNGPWLSYGNHGGSAGTLREGKGTAFEGGVREPFLARWPGRIPTGAASDVPAMTIDLLPTFARLAGAQVPADRIIDGRDIWPLLAKDPKASEPHDALYFYWGTELHAIRSGKWKLHLPHPYQSLETAGDEGHPGKYVTKEIAQSLFDLDADVAETTNVADRNPEVVKRLLEFAERAREDLGDSLTKRTGKNVRPAGSM